MAIRSRSPAALGFQKAGLRARAGQDIPAERTAFPDQKIQWLVVRHSAYRCGGSTGMAFACVTGFPFHPEAVSLQRGTVRKILSIRPRLARILTSKPQSLEKHQVSTNRVDPIALASYSRAMDSNLSLLDQKLSQLIALLDQSHEQNVQLRARLESAEARTHELETQMNTARNKLEQVVARLPESVNLS